MLKNMANLAEEASFGNEGIITLLKKGIKKKPTGAIRNLYIYFRIANVQILSILPNEADYAPFERIIKDLEKFSDCRWAGELAKDLKKILYQ